MATTLGTNILCTALIVGRIIYVAGGHRGIMDGIRTYRGVIEILVESAALYSIIYVVLMILYPIDSNAYMYPFELSYPVTVRPVTSICILLPDKHLGYCTYLDHSPRCLGTKPSRGVFAGNSIFFALSDISRKHY